MTVPNHYTEQELQQIVQQYASSKYSEGYVKGVNDADALKLLKALLDLERNIDLLRYAPDARTCAKLYWQVFESQVNKTLLNHQLKGVGIILQVFPDAQKFGELLQNIQNHILACLGKTQLFAQEVIPQAAEYLFHELIRGDQFVISADAAQLYEAFTKQLQKNKQTQQFKKSLENLQKNPVQKFELLQTWLHAFIGSNGHGDHVAFVKETASVLLLDNFKRANVVEVSTKVGLKDLAGNHRTLKQGAYNLDYLHFMEKMEGYEKEVVPQFEAFTQLKKTSSEAFKKQLRLNEFKPRVLSSFVRNQLIDKVYLPLIGDNLAKQIGTVGDTKRTDLMGMLLLISPPGYGKTTLMEYVCSRLGLIFMKINGPAIGHHVTSLDPSEANNAAARQELQKLNLAFEMGDNVMIYLDDIQHCDPEFLQKFISLCDGQRKIEGVYQGEPKTYDLRGKKVCVIMAGNPYTESGDKFQIPDMLANRADIYNLGDIIGDSATVFKLSYIENCMTSNSILNRLKSKSHKDVLALIKIAETDSREGIEFEANHTPEEINEYVTVLKKLLTIRDIVLRVNQEYIASAAQQDDYRTEPSFKLQGSYRDMNKLAEKVVPIMNDQELQTLILSHYESESQTLTSGAEANLLKFKAINKLLTEADKKRWQEIIATFQRNKLTGGMGEDRMGQLVGQMSAIAQGLDDYSKAFIYGMEKIREGMTGGNPFD